MIEKQDINGREVWLKVDAIPVERENPNIIPTEYFTATVYTEAPDGDGSAGIIVLDEDGQPRMFESPVAALTGARRTAESQESRVGSR